LDQLVDLRRHFVATLKARGSVLVEKGVRDRLVVLLRRRLDALRRAEVRSSYYRGQEYIECPTTVPCLIEAYFTYTGAIERAQFWYRKTEIEIRQLGPFLRVSVSRRIPSLLWDHVRVGMPGAVDIFLIGYLNAILPEVNRRLLEVRYQQGHLLSRTFHVSEATLVNLRHGVDVVRVAWPSPTAAFGPAAMLGPRIKHLYVRELVDAMHAFLRSEFDESVRRVVTSAEKFFRDRGWDVRVRSGVLARILAALRLRSRTKKHSFRQCLLRNLDTSRNPGDVLVENMMIVYGVRNRIVHGGYRLQPSAKTFCHKALSTLRYIIYYFCGDATVSRFVFSLEMQLLMFADRAGENFDLDRIRRTLDRGLAVQAPKIESNQAFERTVFNALRFDARDLSSVR
jgi:hypothetical protein